MLDTAGSEHRQRTWAMHDGGCFRDPVSLLVEDFSQRTGRARGSDEVRHDAEPLEQSTWQAVPQGDQGIAAVVERDDEHTVLCKHPVQLAYAGPQLPWRLEVVEGRDRDDNVEGFVGKGETAHVRDDRVELRIAALGGLDDRGGHVDADDLPAGGGERRIHPSPDGLVEKVGLDDPQPCALRQPTLEQRGVHVVAVGAPDTTAGVGPTLEHSRPVIGLRAGGRRVQISARQGADTILPAMHRGCVPEVVVIGGGVTGAFAAYFLAHRGVDVTLVERAEAGAEASGNNAGNLAPLEGPGIPGPMQHLALESFDLHLRHAAAICELSGQDVAPQPTVRIHPALDEQDRSLLRRLEKTYAAAGGAFGATWLDRDALSAAESRLSLEFGEGLAVEGNARVDGGPYTRAIVAAAQTLGAQVLKADVRDLKHRGGRVTCLDFVTGSLDCGGVIVATGAWCSAPAKWLSIPIPVEPVKGQLVLAELPGGPVPYDLAWRDAALYGTGGRDSVWLGSTEESAGFDRATTPAGRALILERAAVLVPGVIDARVVGQKAGLRPVCADGFPIVGRPEGWDNVCLAVGGGRKGVLLGAGIGLAAADSIVGSDTSVPVEFCSPERWRDGRAA